MKKSPLQLLTLACSTALIFGCSAKPASATPAAITTVPPNMKVLEGKLKNQVTLLEDDLPRAFSEGFIIPTDSEKDDFSKIAVSIEAGDFDSALQLALKNQYEIRWYTDANDENANSFLLRESVTPPRGWGLYLLRAGSNSNIIIEAPHPLADQGSPSIAVDMYRALDARALLIAGAHRDANSDGSADAAHEPQTIFQALHQAVVQEAVSTAAETVFVLQIHGFASSKHPNYPDVIIGSDGSIFFNNSAQQLADALKAMKIKVGLCGGDEWKDLCGGKNAQALSTKGGIFIHLEVNESIRDEDKKLIEALQQVFIN